MVYYETFDLTVVTQEKQLDLFLKKVPHPSPRQLVAMTEVVEGVYREQSAVAQGQIETRQSIGSEVQELLRQEFPGIVLLYHLYYWCVCAMDVTLCSPGPMPYPNT